MKKIAIIDADSIIYKICFKYIDSSFDELKRLTDSYIETIVKNTDSTHFCLCLTVGTNFRYKEAKTRPYKGNRSKLEKPPLFDKVKEYMVTDYHASFTYNLYEADDLIFIHGTNLKTHDPECSVIYCTNDKDCLQFEGDFYDYHKGAAFRINEFEANYNFYTQMITGDTTDNIVGIEGLGAVAAKKMLLENVNSSTNAEIVFNEYLKKYGSDEGINRFYESYKLLRLVNVDPSIPLPFLNEAKNEFNGISEGSEKNLS